MDAQARNKKIDNVDQLLEDWIKKKSLMLRNAGENVISLLETIMNRKLSSMDVSFIERKYIDIVLKTWLEQSLENIFDYLENETTDISQEMPILLKDLNSLQSFQDLDPTEPSDGSQVIKGCSGKHLDLILQQNSLFEDGPNAIQELVSNYLKQFKRASIDKLFSQCCCSGSQQQSTFISALKEFLNFLNSHSKRKMILETVRNNLEGVDIDGKVMIESLVQCCTKEFECSEVTPIDNSPFEHFKQSILDFKDDNWIPMLKTLSSEYCKSLLLPLISYEEKLGGGRRVLIVKGSVIRVSEIKSEMQEKMGEFKAEEVHIVGLVAVYIDSELEQTVWHGINVVLLTDKLFVDDKAVTWDLSGLNGDPSRKEAKIGQGFDGLAGEHGKPGESGGNLHVICNEIIKPGNWKIISNGGKGSGGQHGQNGKDGKMEKDQGNSLFSKDKFKLLFGKFSTQEMRIAMDYLQKLKEPISDVPDEDITKGLASYENNQQFHSSTKPKYFFQEITMAKGESITASRCNKHSLVLWKGKRGEQKMGGKGGEGGKGGQGGFGGTIVIQKRIIDEMLFLPGLKIGVEDNTNTVSSVSVDGESGFNGENGKGGKCVKHDPSTGDVGYIDNVSENCPDWGKGSNYFGFKKYEKFDIHYCSKPEKQTENQIPIGQHPYTLCKNSNKEELLAVLKRIDNSTEIEQNSTSTKGRQQQVLEEATRKKALILQSFAHHLDHIDELNRTRQRLSMQNRASATNIDDILRQVTLKRRTLLVDLSSSNQSQYVEEGDYSFNKFNRVALYQKSIESRYVLDDNSSRSRSSISDDKPFTVCNSEYSQSIINTDVEKMEKLSEKRYPNSFPGHEYLEDCLQQVSHYLEPKSTDDDNNSILHAAFGQKDRLSGLYKCENVSEKINLITSKIKESPDSIDFKTIKDFVLRLNDDEDKKSFADLWNIKKLYLDHIKSEMWKYIESKKKYLEPITTYVKPSLSTEVLVNHLLRCCLDDKLSGFDKVVYEKLKSNRSLVGIMKDLKSEGFDWKEKFEGLVDDYVQFIQSKQLDLAELRTITTKDSLVVTSHENVGQRSWVDKCDDDMQGIDAPIFKCDNKILGSLKNLKLILLHRSKDVWKRFEFDPIIREYCDERIKQISKFRTHLHDDDRTPENENCLLSTRRPISAPTLLDLQAHKDLLTWVKESSELAHLVKGENNLMHQVVTSIQMLNPEYGCTPGELSRLLLICLNPERKKAGEKNPMNEQLAKDIILLVERIVDYDSRNVDPIFYLTVVAKLKHHRWKYEFLLIEIEERMQVVLPVKERNHWRRNLYKLDEKFLPVLQERLGATGEPGSPKLDKLKLNQTLELLVSEKMGWTVKDVDRLHQLSLNDWLYELKIKEWKEEINRLFLGQSDIEKTPEKKEAVYIVLELENKRGGNFAQECVEQMDKKWPNFFTQLKEKLNADEYSTSASKEEERDMTTIIDMIRSNKGGNTSDSIANKLNKIKTCLNAIDSKLNRTSQSATILTTSDKEPNLANQLYEMLNSTKISTLDQIKEWAKKQTPNQNNSSNTSGKRNKKTKFQSKVPDSPKVDSKDVMMFLYAYIYAVQLKMGFRLSHAQQVTIMTLLLNDENKLAQVSTGEGKSLIVAAVAIYRARFLGHKVDVITSNNLLAKRDSTLSVDEGGLKEIFQIFSVDVAHNCSQDEHHRIKAYDSAVVYGELSNFQRDYLLGKHHSVNIRGNRGFDCVIVDEVDCMLLDRGNNVLYLTHDIPGMETLESLYVFIWEKIRASTEELKVIKSAVLFDLYGEVTIHQLELVCQDLKNQPEKKNLLWSHLIENDKIIDKQGRLIVDDDINKTENRINDINYSKNPSLNPKLVFFFRRVLERERRIRIPQHLLPFVERHLDTFLENAMKAQMLNAEEHYVVDHNRSSSSSRLNPQVIIIDPHTGTDLSTSQWDGALHQFLQLKEGCRLTLQSLKSVFISNLSYITKYKNLSGLTGTLGSKKEREFLKEKYKCEYFIVPTAFPKQFTVKETKVLKTEEKWMDAIFEETREIVKDRSLIIFCRSIKEVKVVYQNLLQKQNSLPKEIKIECYTRDYEKFAYGSRKNPLDVGQVIVTTNLAGRGTDIKLSDNLRKNGGLHICLTYLPENLRIEEQAMGRAGRQGDPGSGKLILFQPEEAGTTTDEWQDGKIFDMKYEREREEMLRISTLSQNFERITKQEKCFDLFWEKYNPFQTNLSNFEKLITSTQSHSVLDQWALWLDQVDNDGRAFELQPIDKLIERLNEFIKKLKENADEMVGMTPGRLIVLAKQLIERAKKEDIEKAAKWLDKLIQSKDSFLYPAAHYYRALIYAKDKEFRKNENEFLRLLRSAETILEQHFEIQESYSLIVNQVQASGKRNSPNSLYAIEGYKEQKENIVLILFHCVSSIRSLLGSPFSVSDLQETGISENRADAYFNQLVKDGCIWKCRVNDRNSVPNRDKVLKKIAKSYGVNLEELEKFLKRVNNLSEEEVKKKLEKTDMIPCTRRKFWDWLMKEGVLFKQNCYDPKDPSSTYVLFDPSPDNIKHFTEGNTSRLEDVEWAKVRMPKDVENVELTALFPSDSIVFTKHSKPTDIETVDLTHFGKLTESDLAGANIANNYERTSVLKALIEQKILTDEGKLSPDYKAGMNCNYPNCPIYEEAVMTLVERTFICELVRRQWLVKEQDSILRMKWITYLPLDPYQDLLCDLQTAHIIYGSRVSDQTKDKLKKNIEEVTKCPEEQRQILACLQSRQADYMADEYPKFFLASIWNDIRMTTDDINIIDGIGTELYTFSLVGFNQVIKVSEKICFWRRNWSSIVAIVAATALGIGLLCIPKLTCTIAAGLLTKLSSELLLYSAKETRETLMTVLRRYKNLSWANHLYRMLKEPKIYSKSVAVAGYQRISNLIKKGGEKVQSNISTDTNTIEEEIVKKKTTLIKNVIQIDPTIGVTIASQQSDARIEYLLTRKLGLLFRQLANEVNQNIKTIIENSSELKETLTKLKPSHDINEAKWIIEEKFNQATPADWMDLIQPWFNRLIEAIKIITVADESRIGHKAIFDQIKNIPGEFKVVEVFGRVTVKQVANLNRAINETLNSSRAVESVETDQCKEFEVDALDYVKSKLKAKTEKTMELLRNSILQKAIEHVCLPSVSNRFHQLEENRRLQWSQRKRNERPMVDQRGHIQTCLKLMKKTKDLNLLAALMREGDLPYDPFCIAGVQNALELIKDEETKKKLQSDGEHFACKIEKETSFATAILESWRNYTNQKCPFKLFPVDGIGCENDKCELKGLNDFVGYRKFVKEEFIGESEASSFDNMRNHLLIRGDYQSVIWLNIKTFMLPIAKRASDQRRREFIKASKNHIKTYSTLKEIDNEFSSVITLAEANELTNRLHLCIEKE